MTELFSHVIIPLFRDAGFGFEFIISLVLCARDLIRRSHFALRFIGAITVITIFSCVWYSSIPHTVWWTIAHYSVVLALIMLTALWCWSINVSQAAVVAVIAGMVQHVVYRSAMLLSLGVHILCGISKDALTYMYAGLVIPCFALSWLLLTRKLHTGDFRMDYKSVLPLIVGILLCANVFTNVFDIIGSSISHEVRIAFASFDLINSVSFMLLIVQMMKRKSAEENSLKLQHLLVEQKKQLESSKEMIELINIKTHDVKKQIASFGKLIDKQDQADLQEMLDIYDTTVNTGNEALDVILQEKSLICEQSHIQFDRIVDGKILYFMRSNDVYALFTNALDNAINAVRLLDEGKRYISLDVRRKRAMVSIVVKNPFDTNLQFVDGLPRTTSGDENNHGFGMRSIRMIAQRYGGVMAISTQNHVFTLSILIPMH